MPPKKQVAYAVYVRENYQQAGVSTYQEGFSALREQWKNLSDKRKEEYKNKAKGMNHSRGKMTNAGFTYEELERQAREEQNRMEEEEKWIKTKVHGIDGKKSKDSVQETCFFIIHINKHVVTHDRRAVPAEIGIVKFSLRNGIEEQHSWIIQNRKVDLPPGYEFKMRQNAMETHAIPVTETFPLAKSSKAVVKKIKSLLNPSISERLRLQPVFCMDNKIERVDHTVEDEIRDVKEILDNLFSSENEILRPPNVYNLNNLYCELWRASTRFYRSSPFPDAMVKTYLQSKLDEDQFVYECNSPDCCDFHAALENVAEHFIAKYCALCICKRYAYMLCSSLTPKISPETTSIPGRHIPATENIHVERNIDPSIISSSVSMAVLKEYKNPFSGVDLPKCGTMNGSTYLPKDKDPGIEIERQLKLQLDEMKLEGDINNNKRLIPIEEETKLPMQCETSLKENIADTIRSDDSISCGKKRTSRRLWARFDQEESLDTETEHIKDSTAYYSCN